MKRNVIACGVSALKILLKIAVIIAVVKIIVS